MTPHHTRDDRDPGVVVADGCINYLFPFSFRQHPIARNFRDHPRHLLHPSTYRQEVVRSAERFCESVPDVLCCMAWLPSEGWHFSPWKSSPREGLTPIAVDVLQSAAAADPLGCDLAAHVASDGFFYLSDYFRRQPLLRLRLSASMTVVSDRSTRPLVPIVRVDVPLHLALGQGCLAFRHIIENMPIDDLIGIRLTQFRRGMPYRWTDSAGSKKEELQDVYLNLGHRLFGSAFVPTYDVRQYAAVLELRRVRRRNGRPIRFEQARSSRPKWLYGLLHVDERWRDVDAIRSADGLSQAACHTSSYCQYSQAVSLLILHSPETNCYSSCSITSKLLDNYYWNLRSNLKRTVAERSCLLEALMAQENLLACLYDEYRSLVSRNAHPRSAVQRMRKELVASRQEADESFNVAPGEESLIALRGPARWRERIQEAASILDSILEDYREYNTGLLADFGTSIGVGLGILSILFALDVDIPLCVRWGVSLGLGVFTLARWFKYRDRLGAALVGIWAIILMVLWFWPLSS